MSLFHGFLPSNPNCPSKKKKRIFFMLYDDVIIFCLFLFILPFWILVSLCHPGCPGTQKSDCLCFLSAGIKDLVLFKDFPFASQLVWPSWSDVICLHILTYLVLCFQIIKLWSHWDILLCFGSSGGACEASVLFSLWDRVSRICPS